MKNCPRRSPLPREERKRLALVFVGLFGLFAILIIQFYKIQVVEYDKWRKVAVSQHFTTIEEPARRGLFYPNTSLRNAQPETNCPFVIDVPKFHLFADPIGIPERHRKKIGDKLIGFLGLNETESKKLANQFEKKSRSRRLVLWIDQKKHEEILQWWSVFAREGK